MLEVKFGDNPLFIWKFSLEYTEFITKYHKKPYFIVYRTSTVDRRRRRWNSCYRESQDIGEGNPSTTACWHEHILLIFVAQATWNT